VKKIKAKTDFIKKKANQNHCLTLLISFEVKKLYRKMAAPIICKEFLSWFRYISKLWID